jgi:hypothetical protein
MDEVGNKTKGRLHVEKETYAAEKTLTKRPGRCNEEFKKVQTDWAALGFWGQLGKGDAWGMAPGHWDARKFRQECEKLPPSIKESQLKVVQVRLADHYSGKATLPPEKSLELRYCVEVVQNVYAPGEYTLPPMSEVEQNYLTENSLHFQNSMGMALLGPLFGAPGWLTRQAGATEQQVAAANQFGLMAMDVGGVVVAGRPKTPVNDMTESAHGAPLAPASQSTKVNPGLFVRKVTLIVPAIIYGERIYPSTYKSVYHANTIEKLGYHKDTPAKQVAAGIYKNGLRERGTDMDLVLHSQTTHGHPNSAYRGTTLSIRSQEKGAGALEWTFPGDIVIELKNIKGFDVNMLLRDRVQSVLGFNSGKFVGEGEIAVAGAISPKSIERVGVVYVDGFGTKKVDWIKNEIKADGN